MTPEQIREARARCEAAPPGPWTGDRYDGSVKYDILDALGEVVVRGCNGNTDEMYGFHDGDAESFCIHARTDLPAALDALEARDAEIERLQGIISAFYNHTFGVPEAFRPTRACEMVEKIRAAKGGSDASD